MDKHTETCKNNGKTRRNMTTRLALMFVLVGVLFVAISCLAAPSQPANAQAAFVTPTPLPAIQATQNAAQARSSAAQADLQHAAQMEAQAAELRRNGIAQQAQAQADLGNAKAAAASQNWEAIGEAVGKAQGDLEQLSKTNAAQHDMNITLIENQKAQAAAMISATNETAQLRTDNQRLTRDNQTLSASITTQAAQIEADKGKGDVGSYAALFAFVLCAILIVVLLSVVLQRRHEAGAVIIDSTPNVVRDEDVIDA